MAKRDPLNEWLVGWINTNYPDPKFSRPNARQQAFKALPFGHVPPIEQLVLAWFTKRFNDILDGSGFVFPGGRLGKEVARQDMLPWDEESRVLIEQLRMVKVDIGAVRARLVAWATANDPSMNIDTTMDTLKRAAGL